MHYYKNNEMFPTCKKEHSLKKENYLSEFVTTNQKEFARDNLGITDIINSLDKKIDAKVIEFGGIAWDLIPTEGNTEKVLSSDAIYKALSLYVTSKEIESIEGGLQKLVKDSSDALDLELNKAVESLLDKIQCLKQEFAKYTTQINSIIKAFRSGGAFNVSQYLQQAQSLDYIVKLTLQNAVNNAPDVAKNAGQIITFLDTENVWQQYQYQSDTIDNWNNLLKWKNLNDSSSTPIEEGAHIYNISEYLPGGTKYGQLIGAGVYTIYGDITPVSQYRTIFGWDPDLGEVTNPEEKDTSLVIKEIDTDGVAAYEYYVFVGNDSNGYGYQATITSNENIPEWITKAFGSTDNSILVNINKLKEEIDKTKISKGELKTIQGKSIEGTGNIEIDTYINQFASSNNPINWNWGGDGNIVSVDIDNVKGVKASYSEEYTTGNVYSILDVTLKAKKHYLFSFYLSGEGECDLSLSNLWDNVYVREFSNPIIIDGNEYIEHDDWKSHLTFTSVGYHYISFYANTSATAQIDFEFDTNNNIIFYKPLFVACNPKANINWFANNEDIFTTKEQFGIAFKGVTYNSSTKNIEFTCVNNTKKYLDATDFIKDGMVSSVAIEDGNLVITFNTDSGKEAIIIPLIDIFNPANYYTKTDIDGKLVPATINTLGLVKLYNTNGTNKSGLLVQEDGSLVINVPTNKSESIGIYRDDAGQLKANIKAPATDAEIEAGTSAEKAITPSNLSKVKESFGLATVATSGNYNDLNNKPVIPSNTSDLNNDSGFLTEHQDISGKANTADLAKVATSGSYNDLRDKPTIQELATVKQIYALDATNPDYPSRIGKYSPFDITSVFGTISIVTHNSDGTEHGLSDVRAEGFTEAQYTIDNTTYISYYKDSKYYYLGIKVPFFIANIEQYGNDYTFGVIKFTSTQNGVFKVHSIGITPSNCTITVNGVVTQSLMSDMVAVQVNEGDVVKVITLRTDNYYVKIIGFVLEGNCGVSVFVNDAGYLTEHQDITGKADKVSNPTNGNFAALDSNGNLIDSGHKHSDYLTQHQSLTNYVQKSQTAGLLKNDGTVDTNQYLTQHQDISGKANKNEMNVVPGTGVDVDKTTITLKQGMSATVLTTHQDISGKENAMPIATATGETLTAVVGNYYRLDNVGTLAITLPTIVGATKLQAITFLIACGLSALVTFVPQGSETILYQDGFALEDDTIYEVTALWNGSEWTLSRVIYK